MTTLTTPQTMPSTDPAILRDAVTKDPQKLRDLGMRLEAKYIQYRNDRRLAELDWLKSARQYLGIYDPDIESKLGRDRSKAYPKLTRVKVVSMVSRLMNLLFPTSEKNWTLKPTPYPNLPTQDMQNILDQLVQQAQGGQLDDDMIETAIRMFAKERAANLELEIEDQLGELGGDRMLDYVAMVRKVVFSGVMYGCGVLKGPFVRMQKQRTWKLVQAQPESTAPHPETGLPVTTPAQPAQYVAEENEVYRPQFEFVPLWQYYPDMAAKRFTQMDGQFERHIMSRHQVRKLADRPDFFKKEIMDYLAAHADGNYKRETYETQMKSMGVHSQVNDTSGRKYEAIEWNGFMSAHDLQAAGVTIPPGMEGEEIEAVIWALDSVIIKADINPWVMLEGGEKVHMYHQFIFEEDETALMGNGLPNIMRDSQMSVCATTRMSLDNAGVTCGPMLEVNTDLLRPDQDLSSIFSYKIWYREGIGAESQYPAVREIKMDSHLPELKSLTDMFREFADIETFINPATGGDMQKGPSEPFRTATGASMLRGDAALPFKDVVRNFDMFTESVISTLVAFNAQYPSRNDIQGDFQVEARGATSLIAKEVRGITLDTLAQTLKPNEQIYIDDYQFLKERMACRDVDLTGVLCTKEEAVTKKQAYDQDQQAQQQQQQDLMRAEVRNLLATATKSLTQSDKNSANAEVAQANTILKGLEHGLQTGPDAEGGSSGAAVQQPAAGANSPAQAAS